MGSENGGNKQCIGYLRYPDGDVTAPLCVGDSLEVRVRVRETETGSKTMVGELNIFPDSRSAFEETRSDGTIGDWISGTWPHYPDLLDILGVKLQHSSAPDYIAAGFYPLDPSSGLV